MTGRDCPGHYHAVPDQNEETCSHRSECMLSFSFSVRRFESCTSLRHRKARNDGLLEVQLFYKFRREVYVGASLGFALCLLFGVGFLALASLTYQPRGHQQNKVGQLCVGCCVLRFFEGDNERIFQFCMMSLTCIVLTFLAVNFYKMIYSKEGISNTWTRFRDPWVVEVFAKRDNLNPFKIRVM